MSSPGLGNQVEAGLLNHTVGVVAYTAPSAIFLALLNAAPTGQTTPATMSEVSYTGYARASVPYSSLNLAVMSSTFAQTTNSVAITFAPCTGGSDTPSYWAIVEVASPSTTGRIIWYGAVTNPFAIANGITFSIPVNDLILQLPTANGLAQYSALKLCDLSTGKAAWTMPTAYAGLGTASSATGYTELSYTGYTTRPSATAQMSTATAPGSAVPASVTNSAGPITFGTITASAPASIAAYFLADSATTGAGSLLWWQSASTAVSPAVGYTPQISTSGLSLTLQ